MREYAVVVGVSAAVTFLLTPLARWFAVLVGAITPVRERDVHLLPTPRLGGLAMYAGLAAGLEVATHLPVLSQVTASYSEPRATLLGGGIICLLGALDDRWSLDPLGKLAGQIFAAGVTVLLGVQLSFAVVPGIGAVSLSPDLAVPLTVLLAVAMINAVNFVDGLDGLAAGVVGIAALATFVYSYLLLAHQGLLREAPGTLIAAALLGCCVGFLPHNFAPARLFMGDSGSMLIGLALAASVTSVTGQVDPGSFDASLQATPLLVPLAVPVVVLAIPFVDLLLAVVRRTRARRSPFSPDKRHLHHRLLEIGHTTRRAVLLMYTWSALLALGAVAVSLSHGATLVLSALGIGALASAAAVALPRLRHRPVQPVVGAAVLPGAVAETVPAAVEPPAERAGGDPRAVRR